MTAAKFENVRVRFAPSPTGFLHIGSVRTALFNWLFARQNGGKFILRIEDTDKERSKKEYEDDILNNLKWLGLQWDEGPLLAPTNADQRGIFQRKSASGLRESAISPRESAYRGNYGPYRQSERTEYYKRYLEQLLQEKKAYYCFCSKEQLEAERQQMLAAGMPPKYSGRCRGLSEDEVKKRRNKGEPSVIRFIVPETEVEFNDLIREKVKFDMTLAGDIVIAKSANEPLYNFAATVDDEMMEITHVFRAEEHLSNTPKQILLQQALGFREIKYAHMPLILNPDRSKMSKRFLDSSIHDYQAQGYLPEAIVNFLALLGWHPKGDKELLDLEEIVAEFDVKKIQKAGAIFNIEKLNWLNAQYLRKKKNFEIAAMLAPLLREKNISAPEEFVEKVIGAERERAKTINDFLLLADFFFKLPDYDPRMLIWKNASPQATKESLSETKKIIGEIADDDFKKEIIHARLKGQVEKRGRGDVFWPMRAALSGKEASPDPMEIAEILGRKETVRRMEIALERINVLKTGKE